MDSLDPRDLLRNVAIGEASDEEVLRLCGMLERDPDLVEELRDELKFSEWLRHAVNDPSHVQSAALAESLDSQDLTLEERINRARDGDLSPAAADELARHLLEHPEKASDLRAGLIEDEWIAQIITEAKHEDAFVDSLVTRMWAETSEDHFVKDLSKKLDQLEVEEEKVTPFPGRSWKTKVVAVASLAAAFAVGAFFMTTWLNQSGLILSSNNANPSTDAIARIHKSTSDAIWADGSTPRSDGTFSEGIYRLEAGAVSLSMGDGKSVAVQGPAVFEVDRNGEAVLHEGVALAINESPQTVTGLSATNLRFSEGAGTVGLDARNSDATEAVVFSGETGVCLTEARTCRDVFEKEAVKADHSREKFIDVPYNPRVFAKAWELVSGVEKNIGDVVIELPGTDSSTRQSESGEIHVFMERERFQPLEPLEVDWLQPGQFATSDDVNEGRSVASNGEEMRSYLLQVWPTDQAEKDKEIEASLTFDHPVVGVIFSSERLWESDRIVGASNQHLADARDRGLDAQNDQILLSEDGRTLNLKLKGGDSAIDQVRVLVALK